MPFYDTICKEGHEEEQFHKIADPHYACKICGSDMKQLFKGKREVFVKGGWMAPEFLHDGETTYRPENYGRKPWG